MTRIIWEVSCAASERCFHGSGPRRPAGALAPLEGARLTGTKLSGHALALIQANSIELMPGSGWSDMCVACREVAAAALIGHVLANEGFASGLPISVAAIERELGRGVDRTLVWERLRLIRARAADLRLRRNGVLIPGAAEQLLLDLESLLEELRSRASRAR